MPSVEQILRDVNTNSLLEVDVFFFKWTSIVAFKLGCALEWIEDLVKMHTYL